MVVRQPARREARPDRPGPRRAGRRSCSKRSGCPTAPRAGWPTDDLLAVMRRDKKAAGGRLRFVLPTRLGEVELFDDVPEALVRDVLEGR